MPTVLRIDGYRLYFYSNEGDPREPLHIHVERGEAEAKLWLSPEIIVAESNGFNARALRDIIVLVRRERAGIERAWHDHFGD